MPNVSEQVDAQLHEDVVLAVTALANGAATLEAARTIITTPGSEHQLWFLVRALCHEHGLNVERVIARAHEVAAGRIARLT